MKTVMAASAALLSLSMAAFAADMPADPPEEPMGYNWKGLFIGIQGIGGTGDRDGIFAVFPTGPEPFDYEQSGFMVGGSIGYNYIWNQILIGPQVSLMVGDISGDMPIFGPGSGFTGKGSYKWMASYATRLGFVQDNWMVYGLAGLAIANFQWQANTGCNFDQNRHGTLLGAGGEVKISARTSITAQYNHISFSKIKPFQTCMSVGFLPTVMDTEADLSLFKIGLNYSLYDMTANPNSLVALSHETVSSGFGGFYVGGHWGYGRANRAGTTFIGPDPIFTHDYDQTGWLVGGQAGYNHAYGQWIFGGEIDASIAAIEEFHDMGSPIFGNGEWTWMMALKARAGYTFGRAMLYATAGVAMAGFDYDASSGCRYQQTRTGFLAGVGGEFKVTDNATVKAEYNYLDLGTEGQNCTSFSVIPTNISSSADMHLFKVGFNYYLDPQ